MRDAAFFLPITAVEWATLMRCFDICRYPRMRDTLVALRTGRRYATVWRNGWAVTVRGFTAEPAANA